MTGFWQPKALAYVNHGVWKADCPRIGCGNAMGLRPGQAAFHCVDNSGLGSCGLQVGIEWPVDANEITAELAKRPVPSTRNWAPIGHWQAMGRDRTQTARDLRDEFETFDPASAVLQDLAGEYMDCLQLGPGFVTALDAGSIKALIEGGSH